MNIVATAVILFITILAIVEQFTVVLVHMKVIIALVMLIAQDVIALHNIHVISTEIVCVVVNTMQQLANMIVSILVLV